MFFNWLSEKTCHKKVTIFQGKGNFNFRFSLIRFETWIINFKEIFREKYFQFGLRWMLSWYDPTSKTQRGKGSWEDWGCFDLSLPSRNMDRENRVHNYWFLIFQNQKIGILQVEASVEGIWDQIAAPSTPSSPMPSNYYHYFHTLLIPSKNITRQ